MLALETRPHRSSRRSRPRDGYAGDQTLFAPPFTTTDEELAEMVTRFAAVVSQVAAEVERELAGVALGHASEPEGAVTPLRALVLQHEEPTPRRLRAPSGCAERGAEAGHLRIDIEQREVDPRDYDLIVSLGSEFAAFDDSIPWLARERELLTRRHRGRRAGARHLLRRPAARAGARRPVVPRRRPRSAGCRCAPATPSWFRRARGSSGTSTRFTPPPGAELIADSPVGPQAYTIGPQPRPPVSSRGDPGDHGRSGSRPTRTSSTRRASTPTACSRRPAAERMTAGLSPGVCSTRSWSASPGSRRRVSGR